MHKGIQDGTQTRISSDKDMELKEQTSTTKAGSKLSSAS